MAWARQILRVDLSKGECRQEPLNMEWAMKYLGQRGLATKYLVEETDPKVDPLSPKNKMIMATGPLTGTCASTAGRYSVVTKGALTGAIACSNSGGFFGNEMKNAGYDMIIFEGKANKPVYLLIENDKAELIDASEFWGKSGWDTEEGIKSKHGDPLIRVASIGISGEKGVKFACIVNDMPRAAAAFIFEDCCRRFVRLLTRVASVRMSFPSPIVKVLARCPPAWMNACGSACATYSMGRSSRLHSMSPISPNFGIHSSRIWWSRVRERSTYSASSASVRALRITSSVKSAFSKSVRWWFPAFRVMRSCSAVMSGQ